MIINFDLATCILKSGNGWVGADGVKKGFYFKSNLEKFNESLLSYIKSLGSATEVIKYFGVDFKTAKLRILKLNGSTNINHNAYLDLYNVSGNLLKTITINLTDNAFAICNDNKTLCQPSDYSTYFSLSSLNYTSLFPVTNPYSLDIEEPSVGFDLSDLPISNWLKMHMLDQKIYNANAGGKIIEIYEKESNKLVDTVAILGGFITVAGFMKAGSLIAEQPFRDVSNYLKPSTFNEYIMPNYATASSYVSNLIQNSSSVLGNINRLSINQANVEALKQSTVADIGNATATGTFIYGAMGTLAKNILKATLKYGKLCFVASDFLFPTELGVGSDFAYNGITYTAKTRPVVTQTDNWQYQQTVIQHTSNQATTEATAGTTTQADEHQQADTSAQEGKLNELKDSIKGIKEAISSQAKSIVDTLKAMTINLSIPQGATIPLGFDTQALKDFFTANKLGFDTGTFQEWLGSHGLGIDTASFQTWLSTHGLNIDTSVLAGLLQDGLRVDVPNAINLNAPDSINLVAPESIELVADGLKFGLDETATESIRAISDTYKTYAEKVEARENERVTREETKETRDSERWEKEKELVQNQIDNKVTNNEILAVQHSLHTTKAEGLNYAERSIRAWVNEHSQVEEVIDGVPIKKGSKSNPNVENVLNINKSMLSHVNLKALEGLSDKLAVLRPQENEVEKVIRRFADINPSMRYDFGGIISKIHIPESEV